MPFGITAYGQLAIDEFTFSAIRVWGEGDWRNMLSGQLGAKYGDAFGIRNLFLQVEYNAARPYIYSHRDVITNWGHYNQPLAHPWGANFEEFLFRGHYRMQRWLWQFAFHTGRLGRDTRDTNWGGDIYKPNVERTVDTGVFIGQGVKSRLVFWSVDLSYILNPQYNLRLQTGFRYRNEAVAEGGFPDSRYFYFGLSTDVYHSYQDF